MALGKLVISLSANITEFGSAMDKAAHVADRNMHAISRSMGIAGIAVGVLAAKAATGFAAAAQEAVKFGDDIDKAATKAGVAVDTMQGLAYAAAMADLDIGSLSESLKKMQVNIQKAANGSKEQAETFKALNLNIADLVRLSPDDQFKAIAEQISKIKDPGERALALVEAFGKSGTDLAPIFKDGAKGIQGMIDEAKRLGLVTGKDVNDKLVDTDDRIKRLTQSWGGFIRTAVASISGPMADVFDFLQKGLTPPDLDAQIKDIELKLASIAKSEWKGPGSETSVYTERLARLKAAKAEEVRIAAESKKKLEAITKDKEPGGFENEEEKAAREKAAREAAAAAKRIEAERKAILDSSLETYMRLVLTAEEMAVWELASKGANAEQLATLEAQLEATKAMTAEKEKQKKTEEEGKKAQEEKKALLADFEGLWYDAASAAEQYALDLAKVEELSKKLIAAGADQARVAEYVRRRQVDLKEEYSKSGQVAVEFGDAITSAFEQAILSGKSLQDVMKGLLQDILALIVRVKVTEPLGDAITKWLKGGSASGGGGGFLDSLSKLASTFVGAFAGGGATSGAVATKGVTAPLPPTFSPPGRATGGPVEEDRPYTVGERGREIFIPKADGIIVPHGLTESLIQTAGKLAKKENKKRATEFPPKGASPSAAAPFAEDSPSVLQSVFKGVFQTGPSILEASRKGALKAAPSPLQAVRPSVIQGAPLKRERMGISDLFESAVSKRQSLAQPRALGGSVMAGNAFTVGEQGRELFVPANDGVILPHGATETALGGEKRPRVVNQVFNISTPNADSFRLSQRQLGRRARTGINL